MDLDRSKVFPANPRRAAARKRAMGSGTPRSIGASAVRVSKYDAECCRERVDDLGRWPVGYCSEACERRP